MKENQLVSSRYLLVKQHCSIYTYCCQEAAESVKKDELFGSHPLRDWTVNILVVY